MIAVSVVGSAVWSMAWPPVDHGVAMWRLPADIWSTLRSAQMVTWGGYGDIYSSGTGLVAFPGAALLLVPVAAVVDTLHLSASYPFPLPHPSAWLLLGPYEMVVAGVALTGADALAEQLGTDGRRRAVLAVAGAAVLFPVDGLWGHPEDAVAVGLLLYGLVAALDGRVAAAGWCTGVAVAVQPLVVLGVPVVAGVLGARHLAPYAVRLLVPVTAVLAVPLLADPTATLHAIVDQPNFPLVDHVTPWTALAPRLPGRDVVASGPGRVVALALAAALAPWVARCRRRPELVVWALAAALCLRVLTESVLDPYYLWPPLAVGLVVAARSWWRLVPVTVAAAALTAVCELRFPWMAWWAVAAGGVVAVVAMVVPAASPTRLTVLKFWRPRAVGSQRTRHSRLAPANRLPVSRPVGLSVPVGAVESVGTASRPEGEGRNGACRRS